VEVDGGDDLLVDQTDQHPLVGVSGDLGERPGGLVDRAGRRLVATRVAPQVQQPLDILRTRIPDLERTARHSTAPLPPMDRTRE
jgi:hypothetical protein